MRRGLIKVISAMLLAASLASCNVGGVEDSFSAPFTYINKYEGIYSSAAGQNHKSYSAASYFSESDNRSLCCISESAETAFNQVSEGNKTVAALSDNVKVGSRFWELLFGKNEEKVLIASGDIFGIKIKDKYPSIVDAPGVPALKCGDRIIAINGCEVHSAAEVKSLIEQSGGESVTISAMRGETAIRLEMIPREEGGEWRLGIVLKDMTAGIGTITFIDPESGEFGGLGHGICDPESGAVIDMQSGSAMEVVLGGIHKGAIGSPGELSGIMSDKTMGDIYVNTEAGVFGKLNRASIDSMGDAYPIAARGEVKIGEATIISTVKNGKKAEYKVEIYDIDKDSTGSKSFRIRVKDPALIAITGGIVRGMSGSPIIQGGKLVGAITHVLVADPTEGYGIFIENMLNTAKNEAQPKAA